MSFGVDQDPTKFPNLMVERLVENFLEDKEVHDWIVNRIAEEWGLDVDGQMTSDQEEFICQQQRIYHRDLLMTMALKL